MYTWCMSELHYFTLGVHSNRVTVTWHCGLQYTAGTKHNNYYGVTGLLRDVCTQTMQDSYSVSVDNLQLFPGFRIVMVDI